MKHFVRERICDCIKVEQELLENESLQEKIIDLAQVISKSLKNGGKIILCGNGGSASDAMHFAGEIVGRFQKERMAWPAMDMIMFLRVKCRDMLYREIPLLE